MPRPRPPIWRLVLVGALLGLAIGSSTIGARIVLAQQQPVPTPVAVQDSTFPASLGYAALAAATAVWGTLVAVVKSLWSGREIDRTANQKAIDDLKAECRKEETAIRDRLEVEQTDRRVEAERLLREQRDIMKEVMATCSAMTKAVDEFAEAMKAMSEEMRQLREELRQLRNPRTG